ncbi:MAG: MscL family protein [Cyanobacterium sp. T60_A2020_053]|nr:MscL family protein [Cyanobacterium sp. T60_A2020_053]
MSSFFKEFRQFIMRGNVIDLAVAVIIGGAFSGIINSFVTDIITPLILAPSTPEVIAQENLTKAIEKLTEVMNE